MLEGQFRKTFAEADRRKGQTGETCCSFSSRVSMPLPIVWASVPRALSRARSFAITACCQRQAREHSVVPRPCAGDVVELSEKAKGQLRVKAAMEAGRVPRGFPEWLEVDVKNGKGHLQGCPAT